ncbi:MULTISPECIES: hypothetical protein [unclassified Bacillus (in: firmicutes)]|uniref:hypothetical protein n=1 Tax=unclassified Bacillus (in: firmicutes) TaxID=185979 RepID=UPI0019134AA4|nr:hypothetical protein [Bacillus sp. TH12]MBK5503370.1 hypothetical protein [Bacillus sp. TH12]QWI78254.1 hypothetical protein JG486_28500 [Bacillus mycoides]
MKNSWKKVSFIAFIVIVLLIILYFGGMSLFLEPALNKTQYSVNTVDDIRFSPCSPLENRAVSFC